MRVMTTLDQRPDADHRQVRHFIPSVSHISMCHVGLPFPPLAVPNLNVHLVLSPK